MPSGEGPSANQQVRALDDRYELLEPIGSGGMAEVWKGRDKRLGREVAIKLLPASAAVDPSRRRQIEREARALAVLSHPNILPIYDVGSVDERPFLVTELIDGPDLHRYLETNGQLPVEEARGVAAAVLGGVARAHDAGVVHGDLKPANILMSGDGPKVGDFGVARILAEETGATTIATTPRYAAPEVLKGERPTQASDVYSAGCLLFEMLAGRPPYEGQNAWELASQHMEEPVPSVRRFRSDVDGELDEAIRRAMSKDPTRRFESAAAFAGAVQHFAAVEDATVAVAVPAPAPTPAERTEAFSRPRNQNLAAVAVLGPLAGVWNVVRLWPAKARGALERSRNARVAVAIAAVVLLVAFLLLSSRGGGGDMVVVPDVRGESYQAATAVLQQAGFDVKDVAYRLVTKGEHGKVLVTVPKPGEKVKRGADMYIIAAALTQAPEPERVEGPRQPEQPRGSRGNGNKGKGDDD